MKKILAKTTLTLLLISCLYSAISWENKLLGNANLSILIVDPNESIQDAINNASPGDVIYVRSGIYFENIVINKSITLVGEDREKTIIDGRRRESVISIQTSNVNISGFTIQNSSLNGIYIGRLAVNITISNNNIRSNYIGIQIQFSSLNKIYENVISTNDIGILLFYSSSNTICRNIIENNSHGIDIYYSFSNEVYENTFSNNNEFGIYISPWNSNNNIFYHNNFINNIYNAYAEQTANTWSVDGEGNYWSDYSGKDLNKDGIGDLPYNISKGNIDYYPLMGISQTFIVSFNENFYRITIISNSTVLYFTFKKAAETKARIILFNTNSDVLVCFSRVVIPKALMKSIYAVLINEEEVNATLLNVGSVENTYLYVEHPGCCTVKIVYSELLDWYYQLLSSYSELFDKYRSLNESNSMLLDWYYQLLFNYLELLGAYQGQSQNFRSLIYVFAASTTIFILTIFYFSKKVHEKVTESKAQAQ